MRWQPVLTGLTSSGIESLYWRGTWFMPSFVFGLGVGMFTGFAVCLTVLRVKETR